MDYGSYGPSWSCNRKSQGGGGASFLTTLPLKQREAKFGGNVENIMKIKMPQGILILQATGWSQTAESRTGNWSRWRCLASGILRKERKEAAAGIQQWYSCEKDGWRDSQPQNAAGESRIMSRPLRY